MATAPYVHDRRELIDFYESVCDRGYRRLRRDQRLEAEQNLLKSYIVEAHASDESQSGEFDQLDFSSLFSGLPVGISTSDDPTLVNIDHRNNVYHFDILNPRFWIVHTNAPAQAANQFIEDLTKGTTQLDVAWFSSDVMLEITEFGEFLGFGSEFDPRPILSTDQIGRPVSDGLILSLRRFDSSADDELRKLLRPDMFVGEIGLSSIRLRYGDWDEDAEFALADINHSGKFTERGPSFSAHQALISRTIRLYEQRIESIESDAQIRWADSEFGVRPTGMSLGIRFRPVHDFDALVSRLFNGAQPFRLWGVPIAVESQEYSVHAVDLHVACSVAFDVANGFIRVYLGDGACGNSVVRLFTNIQRHVDTQSEMLIGSQVRAFGRSPQTR